ncbi:MAG: hypothetical protein GTO40_24240 [Deltaproteobacteria bacterium]|nr:hypothetical protein [Deltaproteobacteria bacterium]
MSFKKRDRLLVLALLICGMSVAGCVVKYSVVGKYVSVPQTFRGTLTARANPEEGFMEVAREDDDVKCVGRTMVSLAPPGKQGRLSLVCEDGTRILTSYRVIAWGKGYGSGTDQQGRRFLFTFGMEDRESARYLEEAEP